MTHVADRRAGPGSPRAPLGGGNPQVRWGAATTGAADEAGRPPAAPAVADATVIASSSRLDLPDGTRRWRIRVHLGGNWPADELLGVVTWQGPDARRPQALRDGHPLRGLVTRITCHPRSRRVDGPSPYLRMSAFAARTLVNTGLTPPGLSPDITVNVAGHEVGFDLRPGLSFADLDIDVPDEAESVRLALVRLDPEAALAQRMSQVALVEVTLSGADALPDDDRLEA